MKLEYPHILTRFIFPVAESFCGTNILQRLNFLRQSQYWDRKRLRDFQFHTLRQLLHHADREVPYYRKLFRRISLKPEDVKTDKDLARIPFLTKNIINENIAEMRAASHRRAFPKYTSGSTGMPTKFYRSKADYSWEWAGHLRCWSWAGYRLGDRYTKISLNNDRLRVHKKIQDMLLRCHYLYAYKMDEEQINQYVTEIMKNKPKIVYGYASSLHLVADYMKKHNITYQAQAVITTGDNLIPSFRRTIEQQFRCRAFDDYGCGGEGLSIAVQCEQGSYHINDELLLSEIIDNEIVVTNLHNYAMPLIRYKPSDHVTPADACRCGRHLTALKSIDGRTQDIVKTKRGDALVVHFFTTLFEYFEGIIRYKVVQDSLEGIKIRIVKNERYDIGRDEAKIRRYIRDAVGDKFEVQIEYVREIPFEKTGKLRIIENKVFRPAAF